jgi:hypothetical protein
LIHDARRIFKLGRLLISFLSAHDWNEARLKH